MDVSVPAQLVNTPLVDQPPIPSTSAQTPPFPPPPSTPPPDQYNFEDKHKSHWLLVSSIILVVLLIGSALGFYLVQQKQIFAPKAAEKKESLFAAKVGEEQISKEEVAKTSALFSYLRNRSASDSGIKQEALDFSINSRLLKQEAASKEIIGEAQSIANQRFNNLVTQAGSESTLQSSTGVDSVTYKAYLLDQAIRELIEARFTQWAKVDYLSVRYLWHEAPQPEEISFQKIAEEKINFYYQKIQKGLALRDAIKQRCQDPTINELPFNNHLKIYSSTYDKIICREQRVDYKMSRETNSEWGEDWLTEVYKIPVGSTSGVLKYEKPAVGLYYIVKVLDKGGDKASIDDLLKELKGKTSIVINEF